MSKLSPQDLQEALALMATLANAPDLTPPLYAAYLEAFRSAGISGHELRQGAMRVFKTERFWPAPVVLIEAVQAHRIEAGKAAQQAEQDARLRQAEVRRLAPAREPIVDERSKVPPGYPPKQGPPRDPKPAGQMPTKNLDRTYWPELPKRSLPAWRRKAMYDHGICSWGAASALTEEQAKKHKGGAITEAITELGR